ARRDVVLHDRLAPVEDADLRVPEHDPLALEVDRVDVAGADLHCCAHGRTSCRSGARSGDPAPHPHHAPVPAGLSAPCHLSLPGRDIRGWRLWARSQEAGAMTSTTTTTAPEIERPGDGIHLRDVTKSFHSGSEMVHAVAGVDLAISPGEVVAILGPNGAGKTTALDMVLGLTEPTTGSITSFGAAPRRAVHDGRVSAVLQTGGLLHDLTARETVRMIASTFPRRHQPVDRKSTRLNSSHVSTSYAV